MTFASKPLSHTLPRPDSPFFLRSALTLSDQSPLRGFLSSSSLALVFLAFVARRLLLASSCVCLSDLETSRGEPGSRVLVQADNSFSARRRPVLWADIQDVVHCLLWGTTFTDRGVLEAPLQHGRAEPAYTRAKAVEGCLLLSRQVEARDAVWIADEVVQSRRRSCQPIVFPAGPEPGLLRHAWGRQIAEMMGLLGEGAT